jgi:hypothetical protein
MDDKRNSNDASSIPRRPIESTAPSKRRWGAAVVLLVCAALAMSSLAGCTPKFNRRIGLQTFANAGASHTTLTRIDCIMYRESRYQNAVSHRNTNGTHDAGLFQINSIHAARWRQVTHTSYWKSWMNPYLNARVALNLWHAAGLAPWRGGCHL